MFYRLSVVPIRVPPLRDRREDIPLMARHFMARSSEAARLTPREFGEDAMAALQAYTWPGNVRQLRNVVDWLLIMAPGDAREPVRADMLPNEITAIAPTVVKWDKGSEIMTLPLRDAREVFEREYLLAQVTRFGGNISRTAAFVGMERSALHRKLKSLGVFGNDRALKIGGVSGDGGEQGAPRSRQISCRTGKIRDKNRIATAAATDNRSRTEYLRANTDPSS